MLISNPQQIQNVYDCLKAVNNIGYTTYINVCDITSHIVPWGGLDWIGFIAIGIIVVVLIALLFILIINIKDI